MQPPEALSERKLLFLVGAVQFVNVLDFMMVMPLGPDFARDLGIATSKLGLVGGTYTLAASLAGVLGATILDRFDRRKALALSLLGLSLGTLMGGFATGFYALLVARAVAGAFGGPATAVSLAIVADVVPPERRGRAMGAIMGAFSLASVLGVPAGLELARLGTWKLPFYAVGALCLLVNLAAFLLMPPLRGHLEGRRGPALGLAQLVTRPLVLMSLSCTLVAMIGNFALIPNLSAYVQLNLGYPRDKLGLLYLCGGAITFVTLRVAGFLADRIGPSRTAAIGSALFVTVLSLGFVWPIAGLPVLPMFVGFMVTGTFRVVPMQALSSRVPLPHERARFMSAQSAVQHLASAVGAMLASVMLSEAPDGKLVGIPRVALFTLCTAVLLPVLLFFVEGRVKRRDATELASVAATHTA
jgi:predicted MFS family arabinose efflux permease